MKNRILILCVVLVVMCSSTALALDPMGPPKASLQKGQWSAGVDYSFSDMTIQRTTASWTSSTKNVAEIDELHKVYATIGHGLNDNVEGYVRIGVGSPEVDRLGGSTEWKSDGGDWDALWGLGVKVTLSENDNLTWGFLAQYNSAELSADQAEIGGPDEQSIDLDISELQIAFGPTAKVMDQVSVYGGPFLHIIDGSYVDRQSDGDRLTKTIEEESALGGYVGAQVDVNANTTLNIEYMSTGDAWALAGGVKFSF